MKTLYLECKMGAAGDMLTAALFELLDGDKADEFLRCLNGANIPGVKVTADKVVKHGVKGTHMHVSINGQEENGHHHHQESVHSHNDYAGIEHLIGHLNVSDTVKDNTLAIYKIIAEAESRVHGVPVNHIHFHEVGTMDAVADIVGVCMLMEELSPDEVLASPINTGSGHVHCAHGILPVPAPATAYILKGIPMYSDETGELCTPTGAALLKHFVNDFREMPVMSVKGIGYGMGSKDFNKLNCVRACFGNTVGESDVEAISELACNLDDMTPESVAFACQRLLSEGALDVTVTPTVMKKGRSGVIFTCLCKSSAKEKMISYIFKYTSTLGVREYLVQRHRLKREEKETVTKLGKVTIKTSSGYGVLKTKAEYDDIERIAVENNMAFDDAVKESGFSR